MVLLEIPFSKNVPTVRVTVILRRNEQKKALREVTIVTSLDACEISYDIYPQKNQGLFQLLPTSASSAPNADIPGTTCPSVYKQD